MLTKRQLERRKRTVNTLARALLHFTYPALSFDNFPARTKRQYLTQASVLANSFKRDGLSLFLAWLLNVSAFHRLERAGFMAGGFTYKAGVESGKASAFAEAAEKFKKTFLILEG